MREAGSRRERGLRNLLGGRGISDPPGLLRRSYTWIRLNPLELPPPPPSPPNPTQTYEQIMYKDPRFPSGMSSEAKSFIAAALNKVGEG